MGRQFMRNIARGLSPRWDRCMCECVLVDKGEWVLYAARIGEAACLFLLLRIALLVTIFFSSLTFLPFPCFLPATLRNPFIRHLLKQPQHSRFLVHSMSGLGCDLESNSTANDGKYTFGISCCDFRLLEYLPLTLQVLEIGDAPSLPPFKESLSQPSLTFRMKMAMGHMVLHDSCLLLRISDTTWYFV